MPPASQNSNRVSTLLQLMILALLSLHVALSYEQLTGWQLRLNFQSATSNSTPVIFQIGPVSAFTTQGTTQAQLTCYGSPQAGAGQGLGFSALKNLDWLK